MLRFLRWLPPVRALEASRDTYRHAFETTAIDRDRLSGEAESSRHAYEMTKAERDRLLPYEAAYNDAAADRDLWKQKAEKRENALHVLIQSPPARDLLTSVHNSAAVAPVRVAPEGPYPNLYCVGVPNSAASFLYSCLREHRKVSVTPKDERTIHRITDDPQHGAFYFAKWCKEHFTGTPILAHFDVDFVDTQGSAAAINAMAPDAKIMICLRDPVERLLSDYRTRLRRINFGMFDECLPLEAALASPNRNYIALSKYAERVKEYIQVFGKENVHISLFEDFASPTVTLSRMFAFLGLFDADGLAISLDPPTQCAAMSQAPSWLSVELMDGKLTFDSDVPEQAPRTIVEPTSRMKEEALRLPDLYTRAMEITEDQKRTMFAEHFAADVDDLESVLGRKLSEWRV